MTGVFDVHVHASPPAMVKPEVRASMVEGREHLVAAVEAIVTDPRLLLEFFDAEGVDRACVINYVAPDVMGYTPDVNDWALRFCARDPERLLPVGSIHPKYTRNVRAEAERLIAAGVRMFKVHPAHQLLAPNAYLSEHRNLRHLYEAAEEHGVPVMVHTGTSIFLGARVKYADPLYCDDVAVDFPDLPLILAHGGRPLWYEEAFFLLRRHKNVWLDISGIPPKRLLEAFPRIEEIAGKTLFGSDWPGPGVASIRKNVDEFRALPLAQATKERILRGNAVRLFA
ncbi:MAG: amidohydrolase family protein [Methanobacteriota archaeon]